MTHIEDNKNQTDEAFAWNQYVENLQAIGDLALDGDISRLQAEQIINGLTLEMKMKYPAPLIPDIVEE